MATAVAVGLAAAAAPPAALPAFAAPAAVPSSGSTGSGVAAEADLPKIASRSHVVSAGPTGFLSIEPSYDVYWNGYSGGQPVKVAQDGSQSAHHQYHGALSDTVATGDNPWTGMSKTVTLKDMATGTAAEPLRLGTHGLDQYLGTVGSLLVARRNIGVQAQEVHLVEPGSGAGARSDRTVTGLPAGAWGISLESVAPGAALFEYRLGDGPATRYHYAVVDLGDAAVTHTFERVGFYPSPGGTALSATHAVWVEDGTSEAATTLAVAARGSGKVERIQVPRLWSAGIALAGDTVVYGSRVDLEHGGEPSDLAIKAMPMTGGASRTVLDHATSFTPAPDGSVLAMGGTLAGGEGVYRISPAAPGAPTVTKVATTGEPTGTAVLFSPPYNAVA
ncbi:hypothetical protein [Streptomyces sp. NPDC086023]|uniref:hypothetical protein n=1 Tax=Streptomyces sp. NPDC086023 TaxID=3365746 RepID=UPI0037D50541